MDAPDLRTRKKLATREALSQAARRLALERGLENVRVDDIAAAAGVSPRTYNNYFSSREEAICAIRHEQARRIAEALRARPAAEPLADALVEAIVGEYTGHVERDKESLCLISSTPALRGEFFKHLFSIEGALADAIADRTGSHGHHDLFTHVVAAAMTSAIRVALLQWLRADTAEPFAAVLRSALSLVTPVVTPKEPSC